MQDSEKEFSILVDRSVGGTSILDGQIELMLHRYIVFLQMLHLVIISLLLITIFFDFMKHIMP